jgi:pyruvate/2-oxoglutarate dehydrogenase complex dihydrolipoamide acyltransferase (E2) component
MHRRKVTMIDIVIPKLGLTIEEVELAEWYVSVGDTVAVDDPVCEVETDKVTQEVCSPFAGTVTELLAEEGDTLAIGHIIARLDDSGA